MPLTSMPDDSDLRVIVNTLGMPRLRRYVKGPTFVISFATTASVGSAYLVSKVTALTQGPVGVGILGAALGLISLMLGIGQFGIPGALPAAIRRDRSRSVALRALAGTSVLTLMLVLATGSAILILGVVRIGLPDSTSVTQVVWLTFTAAVGLEAIIVTVLLSIFVGPKTSSVVGMCTVLVSSAATSMVLAFRHEISIPEALGVGGIAGLVTLGFGAIGLVTLPHFSQDPDDPFSWARFARLAVTIWSGSVGSGIAFALFPLLALVGLGAAGAGLLKAAMSIGIGVFYLGSGWMQAHYYPSLAREAHREKATAHIVAECRGRALQILLPVAIIVAITAPIIVRLLYTRQFSGAALAIGVFAFASLIRVMTAVNVAVSNAHRKMGALAVTEWSFAAFLVAGTVFAVSARASLNWYLTAFSIATMSSFLISEIALIRVGLPSFLRARRGIPKTAT